MSTTYKPVYAAGSAAWSITLGSLGTSSTLVAGRESAVVSNVTNLYVELLVTAKITVGTSPSSATYIYVLAHAPLSDDLAGGITYMDTFTGSDAACTLTAAEIRDSCTMPLGTMFVNTTTTNRAYYLRPTPVAAYFGVVPTTTGLFVTHNTGVALNATDGNHALYYLPVQYQSV